MASTTLTARLYEHIEPLDRGTRYEDPLDAVLRERGLGEVTGGGSQLAETTGSYHGCWQGDTETGLFFFGPDAEAMCVRVEAVLRALPIGQNARVVVRRGRDTPG